MRSSNSGGSSRRKTGGESAERTFGAKPKEKMPGHETVRNIWQRGEISDREAARRIGILHATFIR